MRIKHIDIKNFRSIEGISFDVPDVCPIVGANNVGKSNILDAITRVLGTSWLNVNSFSQDYIFLRDFDRSVEITCYVDPGIPYAKAKGFDPTEILESTEFQAVSQP